MTDRRTQTIDIAPCRMPAIPPEKMTDAQKKVAADIASGPRGATKSGPFLAMLRSPGLTAPTQKLGGYIRFECKLDLRIREIAGLMTASHWRQQYEFFVHVPHARKSGLSPSFIDAIADGRRPEGLAPDEADCWEFVHELYTNKAVSDPTYARAVARFGEEGVIDLIGVCGYYAMIAMVMNVARTEIPDGGALPLAPLQDHIQRR
jgi:4-carboxymuconolactone decarboxylase